MPRRRSARAHDRVLDAALKLFAERGIDATSMDAIADVSGVSKATIYKHWTDKDALCLDAMMRAHGRDTDPPDFDSGNLRDDLIAVLSQQPPQEHAALRTRLMPHLMAYGVRNPAFGKAWRTRVLEPPRAQLRRVLQRAVERGQLREVDVNLAIALLFGPMMYAHVLTLIDKDAPAGISDVAVDAFLKSYSVESGGSRHPRRRHTGRANSARSGGRRVAASTASH
jgi:AcrR family transcriptional regulator